MILNYDKLKHFSAFSSLTSLSVRLVSSMAKFLTNRELNIIYIYFGLIFPLRFYIITKVLFRIKVLIISGLLEMVIYLLILTSHHIWLVIFIINIINFNRVSSL